MWYAIIAEDNTNSLAQRLEARPAHVARLQQLQAEGRLFVAGPHPAIDSEKEKSTITERSEVTKAESGNTVQTDKQSSKKAESKT